jgi:hypothetical protein
MVNWMTCEYDLIEEDCYQAVELRGIDAGHEALQVLYSLTPLTGRLEDSQKERFSSFDTRVLAIATLLGPFFFDKASVLGDTGYTAQPLV